MASEGRAQARALELLQALASEPHRFDLFQVMRRLECAYREAPRLGEGRPADEPVRFGQEPSVAFAPAAIASFSLEVNRPKLTTFSFGVFGPNGPLPLHLTQHACHRICNHEDEVLKLFLDLFHHRLLTLFYRAFASAEPTIARDRPSSDRFILFVGSLFGMGLPSTRNRGRVSDLTKLYYGGLLARQTRDADGLEFLVGDVFRVTARVEQLVGEWVEIPAANRSQLGKVNCVVGRDALLGTHVYLCAGKFRLVLGPLARDRFESFLPGSPALETLVNLVRIYAGDELTWELKLLLDRPEWYPTALGRSRLGWDTWIGVRSSMWKLAELVVDPTSRTQLATGCPVDGAGNAFEPPKRSGPQERANV
jgi:type VI secretion system protein ImpH